MDLLTKLKQLPAQAHSIRESLALQRPGDDGQFQNLTAQEAGELEIGRQKERGKRYKEAVLALAGLLRDVYQGYKPDWHLREAMTTSDFPLLFGDVLHRQLLGNYEAWPVTYPAYFKIHDLTDFRTMRMLKIDGGGGIPLPQVKEREPYKETIWSESQNTLAVAKYGKRYGISFEMVVNDDLQAFQDRPQVMAQDARMSEEYLATTMVFDADGPHASVYTVGNENIVTSNPALSITALQTAMTILGNKRDSEGRPILVNVVTLVVPPALEITARNILNAIQLRLTANGGASDNQILVENWMRQRVQLQVNPFIPIVVTSTSGTIRGNTSWALVASPTVGRPAFHFGFLRGRRQPQLTMKAPNQVAIGGTSIAAMDGDFETDSIDYRVRHILGASQGDPKMTVASNGTGS